MPPHSAARSGTKTWISYIHSDLTAPDWDFSDFFPNIARIAQYDGAQIGIPISVELQTLFYNKRMLAG